MPNPFKIDYKGFLNRCMPIAAQTKLGTWLYDLTAAHNALRADVLALRAKLDGDAGVTDTNYASIAVPGAVVKLPEER